MPTKQKKEKRSRVTTPAAEKTGKPGRPKGTRAKRKFEETNLGFFLKYECPLEYSIIMKAVVPGESEHIDAAYIESICDISKDPSFRKSKYVRYLLEYRKNGIHADRAKVATPERLKYYEEIRRNKIRKYGAANRMALAHLLD